jgi:hypothetical protein
MPFEKSYEPRIPYVTINDLSLAVVYLRIYAFKIKSTSGQQPARQILEEDTFVILVAVPDNTI